TQLLSTQVGVGRHTGVCVSKNTTIGEGCLQSARGVVEFLGEVRDDLDTVSLLKLFESIGCSAGLREHLPNGLGAGTQAGSLVVGPELHGSSVVHVLGV